MLPVVLRFVVDDVRALAGLELQHVTWRALLPTIGALVWPGLVTKFAILPWLAAIIFGTHVSRRRSHTVPVHLK